MNCFSIGLYLYAGILCLLSFFGLGARRLFVGGAWDVDADRLGVMLLFALICGKQGRWMGWMVGWEDANALVRCFLVWESEAGK